METCNSYNQSSSKIETPPGGQKSSTPTIGCYNRILPRTEFIGPPNKIIKDVQDKNSVKGVCGLNNLGNTCFMNAGLQCLFNNSSLCQFMLEKYEKDGSALAIKFLELLIKVWSGEYSSINPVEFKTILGLCHRQFQDYRQHDCQEFLALLLDSLHEQLNTARNNCEATIGQGTTNKLGKKNDSQYSSATNLDEITHDFLTNVDSCETAAGSEKSTDTNKCEFVPSCNFSSSKEFTYNATVNSKESVNINELECNSICKPNSCSFVENCNNLQKSLNSGENCSASCSSRAKLFNINYKHNDHVTGERKPEKNELASKINTGITNIEDYLKKDTKTLNTNVLINDFSQTDIKYDSIKYSKVDNINRPIEHMQNLDNLQFFDTNSIILKHSVKETNLMAERKNKVSEWNGENFYSINNIKRMKIDEKEKNVNVEVSSSKSPIRLQKTNNIDEKTEDCEEKVRELDSGISLTCDQELSLNRREAADVEWEKYLSRNQSVVVDTFQGQFKSTVVCFECKHKSETYEPFMYLSIPLPRALEKKLNIVYVPCASRKIIRYSVTLNKNDNVKRLKEKLKELIGLENICDILIAEVIGSKISRILDDNIVLRFVNDSNHFIYAFQMLPVILPEDEESSMMDQENISPKDINITDSSIAKLENSCFDSSGQKPKNRWHPCAICLEDMDDSELLIHLPCQCTLCANCIEMASRHRGSHYFPCPVCLDIVVPSKDFTPLDSTVNYKPKISTLLVPVIFRLDYEENNTKKKTLFGHPNMLYLPSKIKGQILYQFIEQIVPALTSYSIVLTNKQGINCARCNHAVNCSGCELYRDVDIQLQPGDHLAITFANLSLEQINLLEYVDDSSMGNCQDAKPLNIYDCLKAFTQSEILDEQNPWYCPSCKKNQRAQKTLSVWRYPITLIVYLKRFVFHDLTSTKLDNKVIFPLEKLDLSNFIAEPQENCNLIYDLQSCVCHFGGLNSGHYTAYAKHIITGEWYNYNDDMTKKQCPDDDDYSNAYILFYQRSGFSCKITFPDKLFLNEIDASRNSEEKCAQVNASNMMGEGYAQINSGINDKNEGLELHICEDDSASAFEFYERND